MDWSKLHKLVEVVNNYYAFAVMLYAAALFVSSHSQLFWWVAGILTPVLAGWGGYLLSGYLNARNQKHGFRLLSQIMTYEVQSDRKYVLRYSTKVRAETSRMMVYPIGYQWTGEGAGDIPKILDPEQKLVGVVMKYDREAAVAKVASYSESVSSEDEWNYWFVGFKRALYKGETADIKYVQEFYDRKKIAKPWLYYLVNTSMDKLELNVKFTSDTLPAKVTCSYFKLSDRRRIYESQGVTYDPDKQWASWTIDKPKYGYCYRIDWQ
ncbi:MAG TPA: hypothetical protein VK978_00485 [Candidatus Saccharimonadales bacterium]|nr:hypothetical protein [Candidatus Saccharimonadales bacterium]